MKITYLLIALTASVTCLSGLSAAEATTVEASAAAPLGVGSPAPKLEVASWLQGEPVTDFEAGKLYVVEGWATWCGPCIRGIPHLNELHTKFKDRGLVVIGVNVWDGASVEKVAAFVKSRKDMTYRVAYDGGSSGPFANGWMRAAGVTGIPHSFVVQGGKIIWSGHPAQITDALVTAMLDGSFSPEKEAERVRRNASLEQRLKAVQRKFYLSLREEKYEEAWEMCQTLGDLAQDGKRDRAVLLAQVHVRVAQKDFAAANALVDQLLKATPVEEQDEVIFSYKLPLLKELKDYEQMRKLADKLLKKKGSANCSIVFAQYKLPVIGVLEGREKAYAALKDFVGENATDAKILTMAGRQILLSEIFEGKRDLALAERYARAALAINDDLQVHVVLAGVAYARGNEAEGDAETAKVLAGGPPGMTPMLEKAMKDMKAKLAPKPAE